MREDGGTNEVPPLRLRFQGYGVCHGIGDLMSGGRCPDKAGSSAWYFAASPFPQHLLLSGATNPVLVGKSRGL